MKFLTIVLAVVVTGCASSNPSIHSPPVNELTFSQVAASPDQFQGEMVRWGGVVADIKNAETQSELTIVQFPLTRYGKPISTNDSAGRFIVHSDSFMDPLIFEPGAVVSFTGSVIDKQSRKVDQKTLTMPVIELTDSHVWPELYSGRDRPYNPKHDAQFIGYGYYGTGSYSP